MSKTTRRRRRFFSLWRTLKLSNSTLTTVSFLEMRQYTTQSAKEEGNICVVFYWKKPPFKPQPTWAKANSFRLNAVTPMSSCHQTFPPTRTIPDRSTRRAETKTAIIKRDESTIAASSFIFVNWISGLSSKRRLFLNFANHWETRTIYLHENRRPFPLNATLRTIKTFDKYGRRFITSWSRF